MILLKRAVAWMRTLFVCPMHPEVISEAPGLCPKCNMKLDPKPQVTEPFRGVHEVRDTQPWQWA